MPGASERDSIKQNEQFLKKQINNNHQNDSPNLRGQNQSDQNYQKKESTFGFFPTQYLYSENLQITKSKRTDFHSLIRIEEKYSPNLRGQNQSDQNYQKKESTFGFLPTQQFYSENLQITKSKKTDFHSLIHVDEMQFHEEIDQSPQEIDFFQEDNFLQDRNEEIEYSYEKISSDEQNNQMEYDEKYRFDYYFACQEAMLLEGLPEEYKTCADSFIDQQSETQVLKDFQYPRLNIVEEDEQYLRACQWIVEMPKRLYDKIKSDVNITATQMFKKLEKELEKPQKETFAKLLYDYFLKNKVSDEINFWVVEARNQYFLEINCNSEKLRFIINKLIPKEVKLFSMWQYTKDDCLNEYKKRYQKTKKLNQQMEESKIIDVVSQKWNKLYPDRIFAELVKRENPLVSKLDYLATELQSKFTKNLQSCLDYNILIKKNQIVQIDQKFKIQNVRVNLKSLQNALKHTEWTIRELKDFEDVFTETFQQFKNQLKQTNPSFGQTFEKININPQQFQSLIKYCRVSELIEESQLILSDWVQQSEYEQYYSNDILPY